MYEARQSQSILRFLVKSFHRIALLSLFALCCIAGDIYAQVETRYVGVSATVASIPTIDDSPRSGGSIRTGVQFSGLAYPGATVTMLRGTAVTATTIADEQGRFTFLFTDVKDAPWMFFTLYATDVYGRRSTLLNFPVVFYTGALTDIRNIRFAPTITTDKVAIKSGDFIGVEGSALPYWSVVISFEGVSERLFTATADERGVWRLTAPLTLPEGEYIVRAKYNADTRTSTVLRLIVGDASILRVEASTNIPGDCNFDQRVTLTDFSVLAFWFNKPNPPRCVDTNHDGRINLVDFSILAFYWNG